MLGIQYVKRNGFSQLLLRLPVGRGGVLNSPRFCFFSRVESWATAHG